MKLSIVYALLAVVVLALVLNFVILVRQTRQVAKLQESVDELNDTADMLLHLSLTGRNDKSGQQPSTPAEASDEGD